MFQNGELSPPYTLCGTIILSLSPYFDRVESNPCIVVSLMPPSVTAGSFTLSLRDDAVSVDELLVAVLLHASIRMAITIALSRTKITRIVL